MRISCLIVEDADFMREIYRYSLKNCPAINIIGEAVDGAQAMQMIAYHKPDVILLDLVLPLKSGLDILNELSAISPKTKVVVISSIEDENVINKAKALGAINYIKKPFTKAEIIETFNEISRSYSEVQNG